MSQFHYQNFVELIRVNQMINKNNQVNLLILWGVIWLVLGCGGSNSNSRMNPTSQKSTDSAPAGISVNAGKLVTDFEGNEVRANQMYGGKRVRVIGLVNSIDMQKDGNVTLTFHSPAGGYASARCSFDKSQSSRLAQFDGGQDAIVEGTVRGLGGGLNGKGYVEIEDCLIP
jgi:hypothetical protein